MQLNKDQISKIRDFIYSRGFTHIEVEMEILDHVASAVEAKLEADPNKSITKAIHEVHAAFGPLGFSTMEDEFRKSFLTLAKAKFFNEVYSHLLQKKAFITASAFIIFLLLGGLILPFNNSFGYQIYFYGLGICFGFVSLTLNRKQIKWHKRSIAMHTFSGFAFISYFTIGQLIGLIFKIKVDEGFEVTPLIFALFSTLAVFIGLVYNSLVKWAFNWTHERYLKYL